MQLNDEPSQPEFKKDQAEQKEEEQTGSDVEILMPPSTGSVSSELKEKPSAFIKRFWEWSGFGKKTLFEILQFLAILTPIIIFGLGQQASDRVRQETDKKEAVVRENTNYQQALSNYLSLMKELLLERDIRQDKVNSVAKVETLTTLRYLNGYENADNTFDENAGNTFDENADNTKTAFRYSNGERKGEIIRFLYETNLIGGSCGTSLNTSKVIKCQSSILDLSGARLDGLIFDSPVVLTGIDLTKVSMSGAMLEETDLTSAKMNGADLSGATLSGAILSKAQMKSSTLQNINLTDAFLDKANLSNSLLNSADLSGARLQDANLSGADLRGAKLKNAYLNGADLRDANFNGADLKNGKFHGATYSSKTIFPEGFDPAREGMINER